MTWLRPYSERVYAVLRLLAGLMFACHGAQKLFGVLGGESQLGNPMMVAAGAVELVGGLLIAMGLLVEWAAFVSSGQMAVAYFMAHAPQGFWPIRNGGELAVLYCFVFLFIASRGPGVMSVDAMRSSRAAAR